MPTADSKSCGCALHGSYSFINLKKQCTEGSHGPTCSRQVSGDIKAPNLVLDMK